MDRLFVLRLASDDPCINSLPNWSAKFNSSVGEAKNKLNAGMAMPSGGVMCRSSRMSEAEGKDVFYWVDVLDGCAQQAAILRNLTAQESRDRQSWSVDMANEILSMGASSRDMLQRDHGEWDDRATLKLLQAATKYLMAEATSEHWEQVSQAVGRTTTECQFKLAVLTVEKSAGLYAGATGQTAAMRKCLNVMTEIAEKQRRLVTDFRYVSRRFISALAPESKDSMLTPEEFSVLFRNWDNIAQAHGNLLRGIQPDDDRTVQVWLPKMMAQFRQFFKIITPLMFEFAPGAAHAETVVLKLSMSKGNAWKQFLDSVPPPSPRTGEPELAPSGVGVPKAPRTLQSLLIAPVQYLCRYTLLFRELLPCLQTVVQERRSYEEDERAYRRAFARAFSAHRRMARTQSALAAHKDRMNGLMQLLSGIDETQISTPTKTSGSPQHSLSDGAVAAVGMRVVAVADSSKGHYVAGAVGTVARLNRHDPVVKWDSNVQEHQTNRHKLRRACPRVASAYLVDAAAVQTPSPGAESPPTHEESKQTALAACARLVSFLAEQMPVKARAQVSRSILLFSRPSPPAVPPLAVGPRLVRDLEALITQSDEVNIEVNLEVHNRQSSEDLRAHLDNLATAGVVGHGELLSQVRTFELALNYKYIQMPDGKHAPVPGVTGIFCYSDMVALVVQKKKLLTFMLRDILVSQTGSECNFVINSHTKRCSSLKRYTIGFDSSEICRKFCNQCTQCRVGFFETVDSCPFWVATESKVPTMQILPESLPAVLTPDLAPDCALFPDPGHLTARIVNVPLRIRNLPFMAAPSKKIRRGLKYRRKKESKTVSQSQIHSIGVVHSPRSKVLVRGAPRARDPEQVKVASLRHGARVEVLGCIRAFDDQHCVLLQIKPFHKRKGLNVPKKLRWVGYVEPRFVNQAQKLARDRPSLDEAKIVEGSRSRTNSLSQSASTNDHLVFKANKTLRLFVIWPSCLSPAPWLRKDFVRVTGTSSDRRVRRNALASRTHNKPRHMHRVSQAQFVEESDPCLSICCNDVFRKYTVYESRSPTPADTVVRLGIPECPSRIIANREFDVKDAQKYNFAVAFDFLDEETLKEEKLSAGAEPAATHEESNSTKPGLRRTVENDSDQTNPDPAATVRIHDIALSPMPKRKKENVSRLRSDAKDFGLLSPLLELNLYADASASCMDPDSPMTTEISV